MKALTKLTNMHIRKKQSLNPNIAEQQILPTVVIYISNEIRLSHTNSAPCNMQDHPTSSILDHYPPNRKKYQETIADLIAFNRSKLSLSITSNTLKTA